MRTPILVLGGFGLLALFVQSGLSGDGQKTIAAKLKASEEKIYKETKVEKALLREDQTVILDALPELEKLVDSSDVSPEKARIMAAALAATTWERMRGVGSKAEKPLKVVVKYIKTDQKLSSDAFLTSAGAFGYIVITSDPAGASVTLRDVSWGTTKTEGWEEIGRYKIVLEKDGYDTLEETVTIGKGRQKYNGVLKRQCR